MYTCNGCMSNIDEDENYANICSNCRGKLNTKEIAELMNEVELSMEDNLVEQNEVEESDGEYYEDEEKEDVVDLVDQMKVNRYGGI